MVAAIEVIHLRKLYGDVVAVDDMSFAIPAGTTLGLLGGNGAGKTTTISMLLGLLTPTAGQIRMLGEDMLHHRYRVLPRVNFSSPYVDLPHRLTVRQNLDVYAKLYGVADVRGRIDALAGDLDLRSFLDRGFGKLSSGQRTRANLAKALINSPDVLLLDEPTASLDPDTADWVRSLLERYQRDSGCTILLASHNMAEVERMCDDVVLMQKGRTFDQGSPRDLIARFGRSNMEEVFLDMARGRDRGLDELRQVS